MPKQIHATVGVQIIDHPATALEVRQITARIASTADDHAAMRSATAVRPFIARATNQLHLPAQLGQQRITAGLGQQQLRRPEQLQQTKPTGIAAVDLQQLKDSRQPLLTGHADLPGCNVHRQFGITA